MKYRRIEDCLKRQAQPIPQIPTCPTLEGGGGAPLGWGGAASEEELVQSFTSA